MSQTASEQTNLAPGGLIGLFARPKLIAGVCVVALTALGWATLAMLIGGMPGAALGPGGSLLDWLPRVVEALCNPSPLHPGMPAGAWSPVDAGLVFLMWCAMALAMMLPSAAPMIYTYAEIAEAAARKREPIVSPLVIAGGYAAVWIGFAAGATALQWALTRSGLLDPALAVAGPWLAGALFVLAGLYQFSPLKQACLTQCQRPFPFFFKNWQTRPAGVFRLGLMQGVYCLGCCWAMMLLMFAVGAMNVVWMAGLGIVMTIEKMTATLRFTKLTGVAMIAIGAALIARAIVSGWPL
jgi:predicted metal-binding membrane protein